MTETPRDPNFVFVFGSNTAGRHGKGAALTAVKEYGAILGQGIGRAAKRFDRRYRLPSPFGNYADAKDS